LFWAAHLFFAVFLILYSIITALISIIGEDRLVELLFGARSPI